MGQGLFVVTRAVFLDRDGVINKNCPREHDYIKTPEEFELLPYAAKGIQALNKAGWLVFVVTNQRGIARGMMSETDLAKVHNQMTIELKAAGAYLDDIYICPHNLDECDCRKPKPGLLQQAMADYKLDAGSCWMIGDHLTDIQAGKSAGVRTILVGGLSDELADYVCADLWEAVDCIMRVEP